MKHKKLSILSITILLPFLFVCIESGLKADALNNESTNIKTDSIITPFDLNTDQWQIEWPGRVSKHDLVYLSPPEDPMQGIALGNGEIGVLAWCENSRIIFAINKSDLWDDAAFGRFQNWAPDQEETSTTLRHGGRLILDFQLPIFNTFYLSDFQARLSLADATMYLSVNGPFGSVFIKALVLEGQDVFLCEVTNNLIDAAPLEATLERFGSRTFPHWYGQINGDASLGLKGTNATCDKNGMYITHPLTSGTFAIGTTIRQKGNHQPLYHRDHTYAASAKIKGTENNHFTLLTSVTSPLATDPIAAVRKNLKQTTDPDKLTNEHKKAWKQFWLRSLMESGDDYLDNLWHLAMYYAKASQGGKYPGRFINGLWNWSHDAQPWNFYFHWNQQQLYWPLNAAGHHDLIGSYLEYRFNSLPHAQDDARELFGIEDGAYVSDVCERRGYNSITEIINHTPVAQIALDFWRQYQYTGDKVFLKTRGLPYLLKASRFFETLFVKEEDGLYHAQSGSAYEGGVLLKDSITELACGKALFQATIQACKELNVEEPNVKKWQDIISHLAPWPKIKMDEKIRDSATQIYTQGVFKGDRSVSDEIFAAGWGINEKKLLCSMILKQKPACGELDDIHKIMQKLELGQSPVTVIKHDWDSYPGIFPWVEFSPVFPNGSLGLSNKDTADFLAAVNTAKLYTPSGTGWDPLPIVLARLGLGNELAKTLPNFTDQWQIYVNGWTHWGLYKDIEAWSMNRFGKHIVGDVLPNSPQAGKSFPFPTWPFRHTSLEALYVLSAAMNESLLQSHDGIIRIAPAVSDTQKARFTLHAVGGFIVSAEIENGRPLWIAIQSLLGRPCKLENPWLKSYLWNKDHQVDLVEDQIIEFPTKPMETIVIVPFDNSIEKWKTIPLQYQENKNAKSSPAGLTRLGLERMF